MSTELIKYLETIASYKTNKIHALQSAVMKRLKGGMGFVSKIDLAKKMEADQIASSTHASNVMDNMNCLEYNGGDIRLDAAVVYDLDRGRVNSKCAGCDFGPFGSIRSGCKPLLENLYERRKDIRLTSVDSEHNVGTHYGIDMGKEVRKLAMLHAGDIELAIYDHTILTNFQEENLWKEVLADRLNPAITRDLGITSSSEASINQIEAFRATLKDSFSIVPDYLKDSPWLPLIREFGLFNVVNVFIRNINETFRQKPRGFKNSRSIVLFTNNFFYPPETDLSPKRDKFKAEHTIYHNGKLKSVPIFCPGRSLGYATSLCNIFNLDLKVKSLFDLSDNHVNLVRFDQEQRPHLLQPAEMEAQYNSIISSK